MGMTGTRESRSIPASAGEPQDGDDWDTRGLGLSPRVRGNLGRRNRQRQFLEVYPRECGGTAAGRHKGADGAGLSPRVRGNPHLNSGSAALGGSIPASAGEPCSTKSRRRARRVYPRECGGTFMGLRGKAKREGLSPRVRGNRCYGEYLCFPWGSIPASAGEPATEAWAGPPSTVYPRECGGTPPSWWKRKRVSGLSPRVRGNHRRNVRRVRQHRSIPASAGEPKLPSLNSRLSQVYPRECGGTGVLPHGLKDTLGLSPRVRGNRRPAHASATAIRSIPASAGEPL